MNVLLFTLITVYSLTVVGVGIYGYLLKKEFKEFLRDLEESYDTTF